MCVSVCLFGMEYDVVENPKRWLKEERKNGTKQEKNTSSAAAAGSTSTANTTTTTKSDEKKQQRTHTDHREWNDENERHERCAPHTQKFSLLFGYKRTMMSGRYRERE